MTQEELIKLAEEIRKDVLKKLDFKLKHRINFEYIPKSGRILGQACCSSEKYRIYLYRTLIGYNEITYDEIVEIIKHEIAHVIDYDINGYFTGHRKAFKDLCEQLYDDRTIGNRTL